MWHQGQMQPEQLNESRDWAWLSSTALVMTTVGSEWQRAVHEPAPEAQDIRSDLKLSNGSLLLRYKLPFCPLDRSV